MRFPTSDSPAWFALYQNYLNSSTLIARELAEPAFVTPKVFNLRGQEVAIPVNQRESASWTSSVTSESRR
jgi:hypothetical protein